MSGRLGDLSEEQKDKLEKVIDYAISLFITTSFFI